MPALRRPRRLWGADPFPRLRPRPTGTGLVRGSPAPLIPPTRRAKKKRRGPAGGGRAGRVDRQRARVLGLDEVSIRKGHTYRIVVSDLIRQRPIWFGGTDRSEASLDQFYAWLGPRKTTRIRLVVMDMWKPFRLATARHAPQASILFDKFHILRHLGDALDEVRKREYARVSGRQRRFIKGQKYTLLAHRENLTLSGRRALRTLLAANKRLHTAYLLKESFGQLWDYGREGWARRVFEHWRAALKWQRLRPYEKFAAMIERHWEGIAAYCRPENKVALGFVEGG